MILTNGCSFTEGYDLEDASLAWPFQLGKIINQPVTNLALGGGSNDRILRTTIEYLVDHRPSFVIIGWTDHYRNELSHHQGFYLRATPQRCLSDSEHSPKNLDHIHQEWIVHNFNEYINYRSWIYAVLHIEMVLNALNIPCKFFSSFSNNYISEFINETHSSLLLADKSYQWRDRTRYAPEKTIHKEWQQLVRLCKKVNLDNWILQNSQSMYTYLKNLGYKTDNTGHFLSDGHACWAELISKEL